MGIRTSTMVPQPPHPEQISAGHANICSTEAIKPATPCFSAGYSSTVRNTIIHYLSVPFLVVKSLHIATKFYKLTSIISTISLSTFADKYWFGVMHILQTSKASHHTFVLASIMNASSASNDISFTDWNPQKAKLK